MHCHGNEPERWKVELSRFDSLDMDMVVERLFDRPYSRFERFEFLARCLLNLLRKVFIALCDNLFSKRSQPVNLGGDTVPFQILRLDPHYTEEKKKRIQHCGETALLQSRE